MPFLMVNLDDPGDCKRALHHLRRRVHKMESGGCGPGNEAREEAEGRGPGRRGRRGPGGMEGPGRKGPRHGGGPVDPKATLKQKLERIRRRGVWRFLEQIAHLSDEPRSLAELDADLDLPRNKMRSTKAIFAKLEKRLGVQFLVVDEDGGEDDSGNPRYVMPKRIRKQIRKLVE